LDFQNRGISHQRFKTGLTGNPLLVTGTQFERATRTTVVLS